MDTPDQGKMTYAAAGVDIDAATEAKKRIRTIARGTFTPGVLTDIGSFGALFRLAPGRWQDPLLVSSCDGVGTKLKIAFMTGVHNTVGYDLVSHCVSDIMVQGARPLFFLDYIACGGLKPEIVEQLISGLARGCAEAGCALVGGETAEMPDFYAPGEYDVAGFIVGVVDREKVIDGTSIRPGDRLIGLASVGLHTNGYSLARRLFFDRLGMSHDERSPRTGGHRGRNAARAAPELLQDRRAAAGHRVAEGARSHHGRRDDRQPAQHPAGRDWCPHRSGVPGPYCRSSSSSGARERWTSLEMYRTFNMGIGMIMVVAARVAAGTPET